MTLRWRTYRGKEAPSPLLKAVVLSVLCWTASLMLSTSCLDPNASYKWYCSGRELSSLSGSQDQQWCISQCCTQPLTGKAWSIMWYNKILADLRKRHYLIHSNWRLDSGWALCRSLVSFCFLRSRADCSKLLQPFASCIGEWAVCCMLFALL